MSHNHIPRVYQIGGDQNHQSSSLENSEPGPSTSHSNSSSGYSMLNSGLAHRGMRDPNEMKSPFVNNMERTRTHPDPPQSEQQQQQHMQHNLQYQEDNFSKMARQHQIRQAEQHVKDLAEVRRKINEFWPSKRKLMEEAPTSFYRDATRKSELPMARVKKVMKIDDDLQGQMIAQDAPLFLATVAEMFIEELTLKAWANTEELRRKTLQKNDISFAVSKNEHFDFLIDIVPREEVKVKYQEEPISQIIEGQQIQYVTMDGDDPNVNMNNLMFQLENGQVVSATPVGPIGQPIQLGPQGAQGIQLHGGGHGHHLQGTQVRFAMAPGHDMHEHPPTLHPQQNLQHNGHGLGHQMHHRMH